MASIRLGKLNTEEIAAAVFADRRFQAALREGLNAVRGKIGTATKRAFLRTIVGRSLAGGAYEGNSEFDVKAHMGFDDGEAERAANAIIEVLRDALKIAPFRKDRNTIRIMVSYENLADYIKDNATFVSYDSEGGEVNWLELLLDGGGVSYAILFVTDGKLTNVSRSGRAIMVGNTRLPSWSADDYNRFAENDTFVEDIFMDERWQEDVQEILDQEVARAIERL